MSNIGVLLHNIEQRLSEMWMLEGQLEGEGWEDLLKITAVLKVPRTEKTGPKFSILRGCLGK